jgi:uncharacterized protein (DUF1330 family)
VSLAIAYSPLGHVDCITIGKLTKMPTPLAVHFDQHPFKSIMKKAYVVAEIQVTNPTAYADYRTLSTAAAAQYGGQFIARGGQRDQREGGDATHDETWRTVILEFPSMAQAQAWYESPEYQKAKEIRQANSIGRLFILEGA